MWCLTKRQGRHFHSSQAWDQAVLWFSVGWGDLEHLQNSEIFVSGFMEFSSKGKGMTRYLHAKEVFFLHSQALKENCSIYPIICCTCHKKCKYISSWYCKARAAKITHAPVLRISALISTYAFQSASVFQRAACPEVTALNKSVLIFQAVQTEWFIFQVKGRRERIIFFTSCAKGIQQAPGDTTFTWITA